MKKIWFVTSEAVPFAKTGGLADVCGTLPEILAEKGLEVNIIMPWYKSIEGKKIKRLMVPLGNNKRLAKIGRIKSGSVPVYLVGASQFFHRENLYGGDYGPYRDNDRRFIFFSRAATQFIESREEPAIIHAHDWFTGLVPFYVKTQPELQKYRSIFTIHNLQHQGIFPAGTFPLTGLDQKYFSPEGIEFYGNVNLMKAGIIGADRITTVSPTYSKEIQKPPLGEGLEKLLARRDSDLTGIVNGIDTEQWNSKTDPFFTDEEKFSDASLEGKKTLKEKLIEKFNLKLPAKEPLIGMVSRLAEQKGIKLLLENQEKINRLPGSWIILGTGEPELENGLKKWSKKNRNVKVIIDFDEKLAHRIVGGADIYCMPSRFEPCGLNQLYCFQYGTIPVVHKTGGLADTVTDVREKDSGATGFNFSDYTAKSFFKTLKAAVDYYQNRTDTWHQLQQNGFARDFNWTKSANKYADLYDTIG